jgi:hypothetical protein
MPSPPVQFTRELQFYLAEFSGGTSNTTAVISSIDAEIAALREARNLLAGQNGHVVRAGRKPGRPAKKRHKMSAGGRARIAAAQRARWAEQKRAAK